MTSVIQDPEKTESLLRNAGFEVAVEDAGFVVSLTNRKVFCAEVAVVLQCEPVHLALHPPAVLVR